MYIFNKNPLQKKMTKNRFFGLTSGYNLLNYFEISKATVLHNQVVLY